jgi:hypothetical protein
MMKFVLLKSLLLILTLFAIVPAQTEEAAKKALMEASLQTHQRAHRITTTTENGMKGLPPDYIAKTILEFVPPDRTFYSTKVLFSKSVCGNFDDADEVLYIGNKIYEKSRLSGWKEVLPKAESKSEPAKGVWTYAYIGAEKLDGINIGIYERRWTSATGALISTTTIRINEQSKLIIKEVDESEYPFSKLVNYSKNVSIYEYDPNIKIEIPKEITQK